jgi:hypothetical protein
MEANERGLFILRNDAQAHIDVLQGLHFQEGQTKETIEVQHLGDLEYITTAAWRGVAAKGQLQSNIVMKRAGAGRLLERCTLVDTTDKNGILENQGLQSSSGLQVTGKRANWTIGGLVPKSTNWKGVEFRELTK